MTESVSHGKLKSEKKTTCEESASPLEESAELVVVVALHATAVPQHVMLVWKLLLQRKMRLMLDERDANHAIARSGRIDRMIRSNWRHSTINAQAKNDSRHRLDGANIRQRAVGVEVLTKFVMLRTMKVCQICAPSHAFWINQEGARKCPQTTAEECAP